MQEKSCGVIVFYNDKVLLIKHNLGHIGFPKGHVEGMETVIFFIGKPLNKELSPQLAEVQKVDFVNYKEALNLLTYQDEKDLLKKALQYKNIYIKF